MTQADDTGAANAVPKKGRRLYSDAKIMAALKASNGGVYFAASKLGCDPMTIYRRADKNPKVQAVIDNARGEMVDLAEAALKRAIVSGEGWAVCFALKTQGKARGYVERQEVTGKDGGAIEHRATVFSYSDVVDAIAPGPATDHPAADGGGSGGMRPALGEDNDG